MKIAKVKALIDEKTIVGYAVEFEISENGTAYRLDRTPEFESGEPLISTKAEAETVAAQLRSAFGGKVSSVRVLSVSRATINALDALREAEEKTGKE